MRTIRTARAAVITVLAAGSLLHGLGAAAGTVLSGSQDPDRQSVAAADLPRNDFGWQ
ncbi:hypothetical protein [Streptomyces sp. NPDC017524]|uniref:hypothetical protein n=1 Tax=unclassified Streptomyces TaxID=2593676 RepID=UPI0037B33E59